MSWKDRYKIASYAGAKFFVRADELEGGRRTVIHEYPLRDDPFVEDLGRGPRRFEIEAYIVVGRQFTDDYIPARDALIAALEAEGPAELIHPLLGTRRVALAGPFRMRETNEQGGMAVFTIPFVETPGKPAQPGATASGAGLVAASASAAQSASTAEFLSKYSPGAIMESVSTSLQNALGKVNALVATTTADEQALARIQSQVTSLTTSAASLLREPDALVSGLSGVFSAIVSIPALIASYAYDPGEAPPAITPARLQEQTNFFALRQLIQRLALVQAATLLPSQAFTSYEDAVSQRESVTDLVDDQAETASDDAYPALMQLRADLVTAVPGVDSDLAHLISYTPNVTVPSLVLAHRLYGNTALEQDLLSRNNVANPGFIMGGAALEVLANE